MPISYLHYGLHSGYIHNWLVAGPMALPVAEAQGLRRVTLVDHVLQAHAMPDSGITSRPVERGSLEEGVFKVGDYQGAWSYYACLEDHWVDHSGRYPSLQYLRSWAYAQLVSKEPRQVSLALTAFGKADMWLNGEHLGQQETKDNLPHRQVYPARLNPGGNQLLVRFESVAFGDHPHALALQVCQPAGRKQPAAFIAGGEVRVRLPTTIRGVKRRNFLEYFFEKAYLDRDIFGLDDQIFVRWPDDWKEPDDADLRLIGPKGWIFGEAIVVVREGERVFLGFGHTPPQGAARIVIMPKPEEVLKDQTRIQRELTVWTGGFAQYADAPKNSFAERRAEALGQAIRQNQGLFTEIARMALGRWKTVDLAALHEAIQAVRDRQHDCAILLLGLLGMVARFGDKPEFPENIKEQVQAAALAFAYRAIGLEQETESRQLLLAACALLAGKLFPQSFFTLENLDGSQLQQQGERQVHEWLRSRLAYGCAEWHALAAMEEVFASLAHVVDFTQQEETFELASLLLDKLFISLALNSFKGVYGCAHQRAHSPAQRSALFDPISGVCRLMFGSGAYSARLGGVVSLACLQNYDFPELIAGIAKDLPEEMFHRERHALPGSPEANLVVYKTPDYMLASAQDYLPGELGSAEHLWQATFGPSAMVYVNHPASAREKDALVPNFWLGNRVLPRLAQWKDVLIALHQLPEDDWMGFTHAYFPAYAFDEYALRGNWAFARKGDGYLALTASNGFRLMKTGGGAYQELRAAPGSASWICHMGRKALDGEFADFQERILALPLNFDGLSVRLATLRGEELSFGWQSPLLVDGQEQPLAGFKHFDNPYCQTELPCQGMDLRFGDDLLRLNFGSLS